VGVQVPLRAPDKTHPLLSLRRNQRNRKALVRTPNYAQTQEFGASKTRTETRTFLKRNDLDIEEAGLRLGPIREQRARVLNLTEQPEKCSKRCRAQLLSNNISRKTDGR
jgi:hypothetical protein